MADKYQRIEKQQETLPPNEIRVKRGVGIGRYLKRAHELLTGNAGGAVDSNGQATPLEYITIKGVSNAVESAVKLAELIKHRIKGLHQVNRISHISIVDEYEPLEEGLDQLKFTRIVTILEITLSKKELDTTDVGYQVPIDESEVQEYSERQEDLFGDDRRRRNGRRNGRNNRRGGNRGGRDGERRPRQEGEGGERRRPRRNRGGDRENRGGDGEYTGGQGSRRPRTDRPRRDNRDRDDRPRRPRGGDGENRRPRGGDGGDRRPKQNAGDQTPVQAAAAFTTPAPQ